MKTRNLLAILTVAACATVNVMAADAFLSPRAAEQQTRTAPHSVSDPNLAANRSSSMSPRLAENQAKITAGKDDTVAPSFQCARKMAGTPKMISACADHPGAPMPCCAVAGNN